MKTRLLRRASAGALALTLIGATAAVGDIISNTIDTSADTTVEVMALVAGGTSGSTKLYVLPTGQGNQPDDGKSGCNLTGQKSVTLAVTSSNPASATVSPSTVSLTSCVDADKSTHVITVTPVSAGSSDINFAIVDGSNSTEGTFDLSAAKFKVNVASTQTNTPPTVEVTGVTGGAAYEFGAVPPASCSATDAEDGNSTFGAELSEINGPLASYGLGLQTATCTYSDAGGLTTTSTATYRIQDTTDPSIVLLSRLPSENAFGWNNGDVTLTWSCADAVGVEDGTVSTIVSSEGEGQSATGTCTDVAGNSVSDVVTGINIDKTAPTIVPTVSPDRPTSGWWNARSGAPTLNYACEDGLSGVDLCNEPHTFGEGEDQSHDGTVTDKAGNNASAGVDNIDVDLTAPSISWNGGPADGVSYYFGSVPTTPTCTSIDNLSGENGCTVSGYADAVGAQTMTATALDVAGNESTQSRTFNVLAWTLKGFYSPVDMNGVWNTVKGGSTVPLKFEVFAGDTELTDPAVVDSFAVTPISCSLNAPTDEMEWTTTGGTSLRYDATAGQFIQNWQTLKKPGYCYKVTMTTLDGNNISANFKLK